MLTPYNIEITEDGSFQFTTDKDHEYKVYFSETIVPDSEGNFHTFFNFGFSRDGEHECNPFTAKFDSKIRDTIIYIINEIFERHEHRALIYFCFGDDGRSRHRKIVFNQWKSLLSPLIESHNAIINYEAQEIFSCLMLIEDNPLKRLILEAFQAYLQDFQ